MITRKYLTSSSESTEAESVWLGLVTPTAGPTLWPSGAPVGYMLPASKYPSNPWPAPPPACVAIARTYNYSLTTFDCSKDLYWWQRKLPVCEVSP